MKSSSSLRSFLPRALGTFLLLQGFSSAVAWATCSCPGGTGSLEDRLEVYDQVFVGRSQGSCLACDSDYQRRTTFVVEESFKGPAVDAEVEVLHETDVEACGLLFANRKSYLVYTLEGVTDACDPGGPADENSREIEDLRELVAEE